MNKFALAVLLAAACGPVFAQQATITFAFENPQLQPPQYKITVHQDGTARYQSEGASSATGVDVPTSDAAALTLPAADRELRIGDPLLGQLFTLARSHHYFATACEAPKEHTAFTGKKTWTYAGSDGRGACEYNYSKDPQINTLGEQLQAVAFTLAEGQRLEMEHAHSPLALDAELENLQDAVKGNRAAGLENIQTTLKAIADDSSVLERARKRASLLLNPMNSVTK